MATKTAIQSHRLLSLRVGNIKRNPMQPRRQFNEDELAALASSIRDKGTLQPIVVRPAEGGYELVAGERRLRAARLAGLEEIPAIVRAVPDDQLLELALIENIHRADLNPVDRARAYQALQERYDLSQDEIARKMGDDRATVANYMRLLKLSDDLLDMLATGQLGIGHGKALLGVSDPHIQFRLGRQAAAEGWSVRQLESRVAQVRRGDSRQTKERLVRPAVQDMQQRLTQAVGTKVSIQEGRRRHAGRVVIEYYSLDDFERIVSMLGVEGDV